MSVITNWSLPVIVFLIVSYGFVKNINVFEAFLTGAANGISIAVKILPALVGLVTAVGIFRASGALDMLTLALAPLAKAIGLPKEVIPLALLRPISGSGALVIVNDILENYGPNSFAGRVASVIQGSTETTFYTIAVYFGAVGIKKIRHTAVSALAADITGFICSAIFVNLLFDML